MKKFTVVLTLLLTALLLGGAALCEAPEAVCEAVEPAAGLVELALDEAPVSNEASRDPVYEASVYEIVPEAARAKGEFYAGDRLIIIPGDGYLASCVSSNPEVASVYGFIPSRVTVNLASPGRAKITVRRDDGRQHILMLTVLDPNLPTAIAADADRFELRAGGDLNAVDHVTLEPA